MCFLRELEQGGALMPNAEETLAELSKRYAVHIATNGLVQIQTGRLKAISKYFVKAHISESLGAINPTKAFFARMLDEIGTSPSRCLMIGDSLRSDVLGGARSGMDTCWFNTRGESLLPSISPTFSIGCLSELLAVL